MTLRNLYGIRFWIHCVCIPTKIIICQAIWPSTPCLFGYFDPGRVTDLLQKCSLIFWSQAWLINCLEMSVFGKPVAPSSTKSCLFFNSLNYTEFRNSVGIVIFSFIIFPCRGVNEHKITRQWILSTISSLCKCTIAQITEHSLLETWIINFWPLSNMKRRILVLSVKFPSPKL